MRSPNKILIIATLAAIAFALGCGAQTNPVADPPEWIYQPHGNFIGKTDRPLRYWPSGGDFVITNGAEFFNRPLYGMNSAFRIDGGDKPEFSLYLPGRGGNLRFGIKTTVGVKWLQAARQIVARYRPGSMLYEIRDSLLGGGVLNLAVLPLAKTKGVIVRAEVSGPAPQGELVFAFGGANGMKGRRGGDIGCEREPVGELFQLKPDQCQGSEFTLTTNAFILRAKGGTISGQLSGDTRLGVADATKWANLGALIHSAVKTNELAVVVGQTKYQAGQPLYLVLQQSGSNQIPEVLANLQQAFTAAEEHRRAIAEQVIVETPDAFINAAAAALNMAAEAVWDQQQQSFMHGAVAWRTRLLGWRGPYAGDALGWHERTAAHFAGYAQQQNTSAVPEKSPPADENVNLTRNETALHSNGDLMNKSHYDMNLVAVDAFFRHLLWTGDLDYARKMWPVIERHLAWERRLFRREFGEDKLPLYEAYAAIWASDDLQYHGGGATHATAYNYWHNKMAARVAGLIGQDPTPYAHEAELIQKAMKKYLWLADQGWFAEFKDYLGLQLTHDSPALWTFYHTIDSEAATPLEAWQMSRFVDTQIAHIPISGPGVPNENLVTLPTSNWMPYMWSINNVVMAEVAHTSLAFWQAERADEAFRIFKGCLLDSMYLGLCPGNVGAMTQFDMARGEAQRDFADGVGATSRALIEGLFGVRPDALAGELKIAPGFPATWDHASVRHPDFNFSFRRDGLTDTFSVEQKFTKPMALRLQIIASRDDVAEVMVNGQAAKWSVVADSVGRPRVEIDCEPAVRHNVVVTWRGRSLTIPSSVSVVDRGEKIEGQMTMGDALTVVDQQNALGKITVGEYGFNGVAIGTAGQRTAFARAQQGSMSWWQPVSFEIRAVLATHPQMDWNTKLPVATKLDMVDLTSAFNDKITQIFRNEYRSPRSPFCSLAMPKQGIGGWCDPKAEAVVDDSGVRSVAAANGGEFLLPNGVLFRTPGEPEAKNIAFVSQWDNYPREISVPLAGKSTHVFLLMAGSSNPMQSRMENGEVVVTYTDGTAERLALSNPTNWWPIDQGYFIDDYAFKRNAPIPPRVDLKTGVVRVLDVATFKGRGGKLPGGAATVLDLPLNAAKDLKSLTVRALANEVVIGLMSVTLER